MTNRKLKRALVLGATGLVGGYCLKELLNNDEYGEIIVLARRSIPIEHKKLKVSVINFEQYTLSTDRLKVDCVFCCLGTTIKKAGSRSAFRKVDYNYPLDFAVAVKAVGNPIFVIVTALGANNKSRIFYNRVKGEVEEALARIQFKSLIILRPSLLLGVREEARFGEKLATIIIPLFQPLFIGALKKYRPVSAAVVARAMVQFAGLNPTGIRIIESDQIAETDAAP